MMNSEYFPHPYPDYIGQTVSIPRAQYSDEIRKILSSFESKDSEVPRMVFEDGTMPTSHGVKESNLGIYTGVAGVAYMYWQLYAKSSDKGYITKCGAILHPYLKMCLKTNSVQPLGIDNQGMGFYCGAPGVLALGVLLFIAEGDKAKAMQLLGMLTSKELVTAALSPECPNELLYGRAGYLYSIMTAYKFAQIPFPVDVMHQVATRILETAQPHPTFLYVWPFSRQNYLGAAHGSIGILYILLCVWEVLSIEQQVTVKQTIDALCKYIRKNGSVPTIATENDSKKQLALVHFCHGVPGAVFLLSKMYWVFTDTKYLTLAKDLCINVIWKEGILRKGSGLCHGVSGNTYCFLTLYRMTRDHRYLYYATCFIKTMLESKEWANARDTYVDSSRYVTGVPDSPLSLMEGGAGVAVCLTDMLLPEYSFFPGFETSTGPPMCEYLDAAYYPIGLPHAPLHRQLDPGVWAVPVMHPDYCEKFVEEVWSMTSLEQRKVDAIRIGEPFQRLVNSLTGFVQRFAENVMLQEDMERMYTKRGPGSSEILSSFAAQRTTLLRNLTTDSAELGDERPETPPLQPPRTFRDVSYPLHVWRAYIIRYDAENHPSIQSHCDAGDITFNLCLRHTGQKGELVFEGTDRTNTLYNHIPGEATIFWGNVMHHTHDFKGKGERVQLVLLLNFLRPVVGGNEIATKTLPFMSLATDVRLHVLSFCDLQTVTYVAYSCKSLYEETNSPVLWRELYALNVILNAFYPREKLERQQQQQQEEGQQEGGGEEGKTSPPPEDAPVSPIIRRLQLSNSNFVEAAHKKVINHGPDGWKKTYKSVFEAHAMYQEDLRLERKDRDRFFWRAIIGMYPVHNMRNIKRDQGPGKSPIRAPSRRIAMMGGEHEEEEEEETFHYCVECEKEGDYY